MNIGLIADVHGNVHGLRACVEDLLRHEAGLILCAGDVVGYYPFVNETIRFLRKWNVMTILGNHDLYLLRKGDIHETRYKEYGIDWAEQVITSENRSYLRDCPASYHGTFDGITLAMFHGSPWNIEEYIYPDRTDFARFTGSKEAVVVLGHTHYPMLQAVPGGPLVVNSGSCGQPRDGIPLASYALFDTATATVSIFRVAYDIDAVAKATERAGLPRGNIDILYRRNNSEMPGDLNTPKMIQVIQGRPLTERDR